jgi:hypothetical protein
MQFIHFALLPSAINPEETVATIERNLLVLAVILELA